MKSAIVCLVIVAVFVYVNAMPADGDTPAVTTTAPSAAPPAGGTTSPAGEETTEPPATPKALNPIEQLASFAQEFSSAFGAGLKQAFGTFSGTG